MIIPKALDIFGNIKKKGNDAQGCRLINQNYIINKLLEVIGIKMFSRFNLCNDNLSFHIIHCC